MYGKEARGVHGKELGGCMQVWEGARSVHACMGRRLGGCMGRS